MTLIRFAQPRAFLLLRHREALTLYLTLAQMFELPSVIALSLAATRVYRNLAEYVYGSTVMYSFLSIPQSPAAHRLG